MTHRPVVFGDRRELAATASRASRGALAEASALTYLREQGLRPVSENYSCRHGEIDLIMSDGDVLVFVEVRYRGRGSLVSAGESIDGKKRRRLCATASHFLQRHARFQDFGCRFDVVAIDDNGPRIRTEWISGAFEPEGPM